MSKYAVVPGLEGPEVHEIDIAAIGDEQFKREYPVHFDTLAEALADPHTHVAAHFERERNRLGDKFETEMDKWAKQKELDARYPRSAHVLNVHRAKPKGTPRPVELPSGIPAAPASQSDPNVS